MTTQGEISREWLVERCTLANIYCVNFSGELKSGDPAHDFAVNLESSYRIEPGRLDYLFEATCEPRRESGEPVALIQTSIIAALEVDDDVDTGQISSDVADWMGAHLALYAAYPYIREAVQGLAARLGIPNLTMDLLKRGEPLPAGLSFGGPTQD